MKMCKDMGTNTDMDTDMDTYMNTPKHPPHTHWQTLPLLYQIAVVIVSKILRQTKFHEIPHHEIFPGQPAVHRTHVHS
jgi:hypothetical protein